MNPLTLCVPYLVLFLMLMAQIIRANAAERREKRLQKIVDDQNLALANSSAALQRLTEAVDARQAAEAELQKYKPNQPYTNIL